MWGEQGKPGRGMKNEKYFASSAEKKRTHVNASVRGRRRPVAARGARCLDQRVCWGWGGSARARGSCAQNDAACTKGAGGRAGADAGKRAKGRAGGGESEKRDNKKGGAGAWAQHRARTTRATRKRARETRKEGTHSERIKLRREGPRGACIAKHTCECRVGVVWVPHKTQPKMLANTREKNLSSLYSPLFFKCPTGT